MKKPFKKSIRKMMSIICTMMLALVCVTSLGLKPQDAHAACSHQFNGSFQTTWPTCTKKGERIGKCTKCGKVVYRQPLSATGHKWVDKKVIQTRTCTRDGIVDQRCTNCGKTRTNRLYAMGHSCSGLWTTTKEATCVQKGEKVMKCSRLNCGAVLQRQTIPPKGHDTFYEYDRVAGWKRKHCHRCDLDDWVEELNEANCPVDGTTKNYKAGEMKFSGEINFDNTISAQYLKLTNRYVEGDLKLSSEEKATKDNLKNHGIKFKFNSDGTGKAYLYYSSKEDRQNQIATDGELQPSWNFYAYVKKDGNDLILYPAATGNYSDANGTNVIMDYLHTVTFEQT